MMPTYVETNRYLYLTTPIEGLLLRGFSGHEAISQLFSFQLDLIAPNQVDVAFDKLLGQKVSFGVVGVETKQEPRHFNGIVTQVSQGARDRVFTSYQVTVWPEVWKFTRIKRSRIFQHITIPDVLKKVLEGFDVDYQLPPPWHEREYVTQYRETDWDFASRLMEEEGIYYFFKFSKGKHQLVLGNTSKTHPDCPDQSQLIYEMVEGGLRDEERITTWEKTQELRPGKHLLWDHTFQLPHKHLEADKTIKESVVVGKVTHKLKVGDNEKLEIYDWPGGYANRFDGIDKSGGEKSGDLTKIFADNKRTVGIRGFEEETASIVIHGTSNYRQVTAGHKFTLERHFNANGQYIFTSATHNATEGSFRSYGPGEVGEDHYENSFTSIPFALGFSPPRVTPKPYIPGTQTGVVTGPAGEEIFPDRYGRVKVKLHWDRDNTEGVDTSCWLRVATPWAGDKWGMIHIPRIKQEVLIAFMEGDPDKPIIVGSVYNAEMMPPYKLPDHKTVSTTKSRSTLKGALSNYNEFRFEDKKGHEQVFLHAEKDKDERVKNESREWVGASRHLTVAKNQQESVGGSKHSDVGKDVVVQIGGNEHSSVGGSVCENIGASQDTNIGANRVVKIGGSAHRSIDGSLSEKIGGSASLTVSGNSDQKVGGNLALETGMIIHLKAGMTAVIEAGVQLTLKVGGNFIDISPAGVSISGTMVLINSGGAPGAGPGAQPQNPKAPEAAGKPEKPDAADDGSKFNKM